MKVLAALTLAAALVACGTKSGASSTYAGPWITCEGFIVAPVGAGGCPPGLGAQMTYTGPMVVGYTHAGQPIVATYQDGKAVATATPTTSP
jgi:hypothetical protein